VVFIKNKGIVLYDFLLVQGGAESVSLALVEQLPKTSLCVDFLSELFLDKTLHSDVKMISIGRYSRNVVWQYLKGIFNFTYKTRFISTYDWVIFSGTNAPCAVHNHAQGKNILYCHTVPRFVYDLKSYWLKKATWWQYPILLLLIWHVRRHYEAAIDKMDIVIANSENVQQRILQYLGRDSEVIYPPVDIARFQWLGQQDYYLSTSRLASYKRLDIIVSAFVQMPDKKLVVTSGGSELKRLKRLAKGAANIQFTAWLEEHELMTLMGNCIATIYIPIDEDFGMSPVESMAAGKPVIGVQEGGLLETVVPNETGILLPANPSKADLIEAVRSLSAEAALSMRAACEQRSKLFSKEIFIEKIKKVLAD
jgi:glycosyltransferase involved in cell wall biosynthesis